MVIITLQKHPNYTESLIVDLFLRKQGVLGERKQVLLKWVEKGGVTQL